MTSFYIIAIIIVIMIIVGNAQESNKKKKRQSAISDNNQKIQDAFISGAITEEQKTLMLEESNFNWLYNAEKKIQLITDTNKQQAYIIEKYGQEIGAKMINHQYWLGMTPEQLIDLRIDGSVKMIREGLNHTQKVYKSVYEFTNLVKQNVVLDKKEVDIKKLIEESISKTSYTQQVELGELPTLQVNETLFWNAIDNLIKNGLKYNDSENKLVKIYLEDDTIIVQDNGRGLSEKQFEKIIKARDKDIEEAGLGLNICLAIIKEHGFELNCEKIDGGTKMKIKIQ